MTIELRVLAEDDWAAFDRCLLHGFGGSGEGPEENAMWRDFLPFEQALAAWDRGDGGTGGTSGTGGVAAELVGTLGNFDFRMTVPGGGLVDTAGVTMVSVAPTHRRRGLLTAMMRRQLDDMHDSGKLVSVLTASEPGIYGRFGYGVATRQAYGAVDSSRVTVAVPPGAEAVRLRLVGPAEAVAGCEAVYAGLVPRRPGMLARQPGWERLRFLDPERDRGGFGPLQCVLAEVDGEVRGYARYSTTGDATQAGVPDGKVNLRDVEALDPVVYAVLWRYLTDLDLTSRVVFRNRPADDPLQHIVSDIRLCNLSWRDGLYARLLDLPSALEARTYAAPVDVVLEVEDAFCPWNSGRWRLTGDAGGANCKRTTDPADLALTARELGAVYLGGPTLLGLAAAGLVRELRAGALGPASAAFRADVEPWLPHGF